jgi:integrase/recombinase XerD
MSLSQTTLADYLASRYSPSTAKAYLRQIEIYCATSSNAAHATYSDIVASIGLLRNRYSNPKTLSRILACIKVYYNYLAYIGYREDNPSKRLYLKDRRSRDIQLQDLFSSPELEALLSSQERFGWLSYRNQVCMSLLGFASNGARAATSIRPESV